MKFFTVLFFIFGFPLIGFSNPDPPIIQMTWEKSYGGDKQETVHSMINTSDGGQILVGSTESKGIGKADGWIFKVDRTGELIWERTIGGEQDDILLDIVSNDEEGFMLVGTTASKGNGATDIWLVKIDGDGNMDWNKTMGTSKSEKGSQIIKNAEGEYVIAGTRHIGNYEIGDSSRHYELSHYIWMIKVDDEGALLWDERIYIDAMLHITDLHQTQEGGYILSAISRKNVKDVEDSFILKMDKEGLITWKKWLGKETVPDLIHGILPMSNGTFMLAGISINPDNVEDANGWLLLMDAMGYVTWEKYYGNIGKGGDEFHAIIRTKDSHLLMVGMNGSSSENEGSMWMVKTKMNGDIVWQQNFGDNYIERAYVLSETAHNEILIAGNSDPVIDVTNSNKEDSYNLPTPQFGNVRLVKYAPKEVNTEQKPYELQSKN